MCGDAIRSPLFCRSSSLRVSWRSARIALRKGKQGRQLPGTKCSLQPTGLVVTFIAMDLGRV